MITRPGGFVKGKISKGVAPGEKKGMGYLFGYRFLSLGMMIQPMR
jgi:hypothetical protein